MIVPLMEYDDFLDSELETRTLASKLSYFGEIMLSGVEITGSTALSSLLSHHAISIFSFQGSSYDYASDFFLDNLKSWMNEGAKQVVLKVESSTLRNVCDWISLLPDARNRLALRVQATEFGIDSENVTASIRTFFDSVRTHVGKIVFGMRDCPLNLEEFAEIVSYTGGKEGSKDYLRICFHDIENITEDTIGALHRDNDIDLIARINKLFSNSEESEHRGKNIDITLSFYKCLQTDRNDRLLATVVCDEREVALGLVYSNLESLYASVASGRGVYWSRSRGQLWQKGATSGAWQQLVSIRTDCDSDALRFIVVQHGSPPSFCHLNRRTCWSGERGLGALERTLRSRLESAPAGSYTARLFQDSELLRNKLVEEAQELAEARDHTEIALEAADLIYFALVKCVSAGVSVADVEKCLDRRSLKVTRRPGNSKNYRIEKANDILNEVGKN